MAYAKTWRKTVQGLCQGGSRHELQIYADVASSTKTSVKINVTVYYVLTDGASISAGAPPSGAVSVSFKANNQSTTTTDAYTRSAIGTVKAANDSEKRITLLDKQYNIVRTADTKYVTISGKERLVYSRSPKQYDANGRELGDLNTATYSFNLDVPAYTTLTVQYFAPGANKATVNGTSTVYNNPSDSTKIGEHVLDRTTNYPNGLADSGPGSTFTLERSGYKFAKMWGTKKDGTGKNISSQFGGTGQEIASLLGVDISTTSQRIKVYALWDAVIPEPTTVLVHFNSNATGVANPADKTVILDKPYGPLPIPAYRSTHKFVAWKTSRVLGSTVTQNTTVTNSSEHTLYASWEGKYIPVILYHDNGSSNTIIYLKYGSNWANSSKNVITSVPVPSKSGYRFLGYFHPQKDTYFPTIGSDGSFKITSYTAFDEPTALFAKWEPIIPCTIKIKYDTSKISKVTVNGTQVSNGGTIIRDDKTIITVQATLVSGQEFIKWTDYGSQVSSSSSYSFVLKKNMELEAHASGAVYEIKYESYGVFGSESGSGETQKKEHNKSIKLHGPHDTHLWNFTRKGKAVVGWSTTKANISRDKDYDLGATYSANQDLTLYPYWDDEENVPKNYQIQYNGNGSTSGSMSNSSHVSTTSSNLKTNTYKREFVIQFENRGGINSTTKINASSTFSKWTLTTDGSGDSYGNGASVKFSNVYEGSVITLYAQWTDQTITLPSITKKGYICQGWYDLDGNFIGKPGGSYTVSKNQTLEAQFTACQYKLQFDMNYGGIKRNILYFNDEICSSDWKSSGNGLQYRYDIKSGNFIINGNPNTAEKTITHLFHTPCVIEAGKTYTILMKYVNGVMEVGGGCLTLESPDNDTRKADSSKTIYCDLWKTDEDNIKVGTAAVSSPTAEIFVYKQTNLNYSYFGCKIKVEQSSSGSGAIWSPPGKIVTYDNQYKDLPNPSRSGYIFSGWFTASSGGNQIKETSLVELTDDIVVYAHWTPIQYTIEYDGNGSTSGTMSPSSHLYDDVNSKLKENTYLKEGYDFLGWSLSKTSVIPEYGNQASVLNWTNQDGSVIRVYAIWGINAYKLNINPNGGLWNGSKDIASFSLEYMTTKDILPPVRPGYQFVGWLKTHSGTLNNSKIKDSLFSNGKINEIQAYGGSAINLVLKNDATSGYNYIEVQLDKNGTISPHYGGVMPKPLAVAEANQTYIYTFRANIPTGYLIEKTSNLDGNSKLTWLTGNAGTGKWEIYAYKIECSSSAAGKTFGHLYLKSLPGSTTSRPEKWYFGGYQITKAPSDYQIFTQGEGNTTLIAQWIPMGLVNIKTKEGWKSAIPYVYTQFGWQQATVYINIDGSSGGWKMIGG